MRGDTTAAGLSEAEGAGGWVGGRICAAAAEIARSQCVLLELLGEFDAMNAIRYWTDFKSLAHWLSWCCSMTPGVAREHVRVAKALRRMPTVADLFRQGRLSYSKVRESGVDRDRLLVGADDLGIPGCGRYADRPASQTPDVVA
jgi:Domain of unknown function (DUF222)